MGDAPLKVIQVITKLDVGGAQETAVALADGLGALGVDVVLVAGTDAGTGGDMWAEARRRGVDARESGHLVRRLHPWHDLLAVAELRRRFRTERPDVVHTHSSKAGVVGRVAARLARVPVVVHTVHGWSFRDFQSPVRRRLFLVLERGLARWTDTVVVVTDRDAAAGLALGIGTADRYRVIRSGIDLGRFQHLAGRRRAAVPGRPAIGTVTRFGEPKDPLTTVRAFAQVVGGCPGARLSVVGDGPDRPRVEAEIAALGIGESVDLLGVRDDVASVLADLDVFVFTSHSEGLPRCVVEAVAAGLPVVATDVGGVAEVVGPSVGTLVADGDVAATALAVAQWIDWPPPPTPDLAEFDVASMVARTRELYGELIAARSGGGLRSRPTATPPQPRP